MATRRHQNPGELEPLSGSAFGRNAAASDAGAYSRYNSEEHYAQLRKKGNGGKVVLGVLITLAVLLLAAAAAAFVYMTHINSTITKGVDDDLREVLTETTYKEPFYALLLGIDKDEDRVDDPDYGDSFSSYRTDTIILARVDPTEKKVTLISIPRDTLVNMDEHGSQKINSAYSFGGAAYTTQVVQELAGVSISHYAEIDMDGFAKVVDAIGGVDVDLPVPVVDLEYTGLNLPAGEQYLDGRTAGLLGRTRHAYDNYGGGDFYRAANQRMLIGAVARKMFASDPLTMANSISTMASYVTTDMQVSDIVALATQFIGFDVDNNMYSGQLPTISTYQNATWYELVNTEQWRAIMQRVNQGLPPYTDESQDFTSGVAGSVGVSTGDTAAEAAASAGDASAEPEYSGTVLVLNACNIGGVAGNGANKLAGSGFDAVPDNAASNQAFTQIVYNGDGLGKALGVKAALNSTVTPIANDGTWPTDYDVVVVIGEDW